MDNVWLIQIPQQCSFPDCGNTATYYLRGPKDVIMGFYCEGHGVLRFKFHVDRVKFREENDCLLRRIQLSKRSRPNRRLLSLDDLEKLVDNADFLTVGEIQRVAEILQAEATQDTLRAERWQKHIEFLRKIEHVWQSR